MGPTVVVLYSTISAVGGDFFYRSQSRKEGASSYSYVSLALAKRGKRDFCGSQQCILYLNQAGMVGGCNAGGGGKEKTDSTARSLACKLFSSNFSSLSLSISSFFPPISVGEKKRFVPQIKVFLVPGWLVGGAVVVFPFFFSDFSLLILPFVPILSPLLPQYFLVGGSMADANQVTWHPSERKRRRRRSEIGQKSFLISLQIFFSSSSTLL